MAAENGTLLRPGRAMADVAAVQDHAGEAAALLKALANEQRLLVMCSLVGGSLSVGELNERIALSQSALSQHLAVLRAARLVTTHRQSQAIYYALAPGPALKIMELLYREFCVRKTPKTASVAAGRRTLRRH